MKKIIIALLCVVVLAGAAVFMYLGSLGKALDSENTDTVSLKIESGSGTGTIAKVQLTNYFGTRKVTFRFSF